MEGMVQRVQCLTRVATTPHSYFVQPVALRMITHGERKRQGILNDH